MLRVWSASKNPCLGTRSSSCRAAQVSSGCFHPGNSPVEQRGQVGEKLQRLVPGVPVGLFLSSPIQPLRSEVWTGLQGNSRRPIARVWEEGKEENVFAEHTAYKQTSVPCPGLQPATEGLKRLPEGRNKAERDIVCAQSVSMGSELFTV